MKHSAARAAAAATLIGAIAFGGGTAAASASSRHRATAGARAADAAGPLVNGADHHMCLDAESDATHRPDQNGDKVQLWACRTSGAPNQLWTIHDVGGFGIVTVGVPPFKCLDAEKSPGHNPDQNGDKVQLWTCIPGAANQQWLVSSGPAPFNGIENGDGFALDAENDATHNPTQNGDKVQMWQWTGNANQLWEI
jgi:hypothetical protein